MAPVNPAEQMHARTFNLVASRTPEGGIADDIQVILDLRHVQGSDMKLGTGQMMPDALPVPKHDRRGEQTVRFAGQAGKLISRGLPVAWLAQHVAVDLKDLVGSKKKLARAGGTGLGHSHAFHFGEQNRCFAGIHAFAGTGCTHRILVDGGRLTGNGKAGAFQKTAPRRAGRGQDQRS